jgi:hypothetical protein
MKKLIITGALALVFAASGAIAANADDAPPAEFVPYSAQLDWYAPSPATVDAPFAVPQHLAVLTCGGIKQHDEYTITTADMDAHYKALVASATLTGPAGDAEFTPHNYTVTALPDCPPPSAGALPPVVTTQATCTAAASYTVSEAPTGWKYALADINDPNSRPVAGTFTLPDGVSLTINAHTIYGYAPDSYTVTVTGAAQLAADNPACKTDTTTTTVVKHEDPTPPAGLAFTGPDYRLVPWGLALLLLGIGGKLIHRRLVR